MHTISRSLLLFLTTVLAHLAVAPSAVAGDYAVRLTTTAGSFWSTHGRGPFIATPQRVYSGIGNFTAGDYKAWRAVVPGEGSRIVGGRIVLTMETPHANMRGRIVVGTGNTPVVLYDGGADGAVERSVTSGAHDWLQFDLRSAGPATTSRVAENFVNFAAADMVLRDTVPPVVAPLALPDPGAWHGSGACIPFSLRLTDQGGGLLRSQVRRATDGVVVSHLDATQVASLKPGPNEQHLADCIQPHERGHGDTAFIATVWDVSGVARELPFTVRADHAAPAIGGGPAEGTRFTVARPELSFTVADVGAGVASVSATVDGASVPVHVSGEVVRLDAGQLAIGGHVLAIAAVDAAGNASRVERRVSVADVAAPELVLQSPAGRGDATAFLDVRASDDMSGVDPTRWVALVNGEPVTVRADERQLTASIGPLAPGVQRIEVRAADRVGNAASIVHAYEVVSAPVPSMPDVGARTGAFLVEAPRRAVPFGHHASVTVYVARNGRPMPGQLVEVRREAEVFGSATTDEHGVARVGFRVAAPGSWQASVAGLSMDPVDIPLRVAPRLLLRAAATRPRVGRRVMVRGRIVPAIRGRRVAVEARIGGSWYPIRRTASTGADGAFRTSVVAASPGTVWIRVRLLSVGAWAPATSNQVRLVARR